MNRQNLRQIITPTLSQALGTTTVSILIFIALYRQQIIDRINRGALGGALNHINYGSELAGATNSPLLHTAVIVGFWSVVGLVAYTIIWSIINVGIEAHNEVVLETEYTNRGALAARLKRPMIQLGMAVGLFVALYLTARVTYPFWLSQFNSVLTTPGVIGPLLHGLIAVMGGAINIYLLLMLGELVFWVE